MLHLSTLSLLSIRRSQEGTENALRVLRQLAAPANQQPGGRTAGEGSVLVFYMSSGTV